MKKLVTKPATTDSGTGALLCGWRQGLRSAALALILCCVAAVDPISARASTAIDVIEDFHKELLTVMQNAGTWDYAARRAHLEPQIATVFDARTMSRVATSRHWRDFDESDRQALTEVFRAFTLANYAYRFNGYSGQNFETVGEEQHGNKTVVRTRLVKAGGDPISIDYILVQSGEDWNIIDVIAKGRYSELAVRRAEFAPILRDRGFEGLLEMLKGKITEMETGAAAVE